MKVKKDKFMTDKQIREAAPELLEALQDILIVFEEREQSIPISTQIKIDKAINKAIG
jgi:hypothetical protein